MVVLILILLEYGLRRHYSVLQMQKTMVLILILLEYGLRRSRPCSRSSKYHCLNPYSIGIWSATHLATLPEDVRSQS